MSLVLIATGGTIGLGLLFATWKAPRLACILLWSLLAALGTSLAITAALPDTLSGRAVWLVLGFPLIWVLLQLWCYWDARAWRVIAGLFGLIAGAGALLVLG